MSIQRSAARAILVWVIALTMWLGIAAYRSFGASETVMQTCCVGEQASNPLAFKVKLFSYKGVNVSFVYGLGGQPTRIALNRESCI